MYMQWTFNLYEDMINGLEFYVQLFLSNVMIMSDYSIMYKRNKTQCDWDISKDIKQTCFLESEGNGSLLWYLMLSIYAIRSRKIKTYGYYVYIPIYICSKVLHVGTM
jgi:hypothetical protein